MTSYTFGAYSLGLWGVLYPTHFVPVISANSLTTLAAPISTCPPAIQTGYDSKTFFGFALPAFG